MRISLIRPQTPPIPPTIEKPFQPPNHSTERRRQLLPRAGALEGKAETRRDETSKSASGSPDGESIEVGLELGKELGARPVAIVDEALEHLAADVPEATSAAAATAPGPARGSGCGREHGVARRGRALADALLGPTTTIPGHRRHRLV
jgi:hypothetical protein